jgi:hypothetical protein
VGNLVLEVGFPPIGDNLEPGLACPSALAAVVVIVASLASNARFAADLEGPQAAGRLTTPFRSRYRQRASQVMGRTLVTVMSP